MTAVECKRIKLGYKLQKSKRKRWGHVERRKVEIKSP